MDDSKVVGGKVKKPGKRGRKPAKIDLKAKLERSRQSARECRARKKLRYQYLEELVSSRERAICALREELEMYKQWCMAMDQGKIPSEIKALLTGEEQSKSQQNSNRHMKAGKTEANSNSWWRSYKMMSWWLKPIFWFLRRMDGQDYSLAPFTTYCLVISVNLQFLPKCAIIDLKGFCFNLQHLKIYKHSDLFLLVLPPMAFNMLQCLKAQE